MERIIEKIKEHFTLNIKKFPKIDRREFDFSDSRLKKLFQRFCY